MTDSEMNKILKSLASKENNLSEIELAISMLVVVNMVKGESQNGRKIF